MAGDGVVMGVVMGKNMWKNIGKTWVYQKICGISMVYGTSFGDIYGK